MSGYPNTSNTRVFTIKNRAGPPNAPKYQGCMKAGSLSKPKGEPTMVTCPDPNKYGGFKVVSKIPGEDGLPGITLTARYVDDASDLLSMVNRGCDVDIQIHVGKCANPQDFNAGWEKVVVLEAAAPGDYSIADFGALDQGDKAAMLEEMPFKGEELYEITHIAFEEQAEAEAVQEIIAIMICDAVECGDCDNPSDGCEKVFALTLTVGGSPGAKAEVLFTGDGGTTWEDTEIDTLAANEDPNDMACVGKYLVVVSVDSDSLHYAELADILEGTEVWAEVTTGFVAAGSPRAIFSYSPRHTWIVGEGGYVYFTEDPTTSVIVQTAGTVTINPLNCIHGYDQDNILAGGDLNTLLITRNGGDTWALANGPAGQATDDILTVWMRGPDEWVIGFDDGTVWFTIDAGTNWTQKILPGQATLEYIYDIKFSTPTVGWIAAATRDAGKIYRSIDGGYSWYVAPEGNLSLMSNDRINEIAVCVADPNIIYAGGLADDAIDGIIVKGS